MDKVNVMVRVRPLLSFEGEPAWLVKEQTITALGNHKQVTLTEQEQEFAC